MRKGCFEISKRVYQDPYLNGNKIAIRYYVDFLKIPYFEGINGDAIRRTCLILSITFLY